ncbi:bifunctional hydroxymethylpyrimidine kinase/phosphomethylpyrimidine kinase [Sulfuracidifex metallicus]|uniref:bifunctional hydroxymethylpyrimidine kinase/phosphomethylpyrimidine kinase n=1 Tax=Sulfuracidifex metallicus TaxID=47303 RepID=UPI0022747F71|nr:bifunctional hydroxymethylpyrimidine kinase/phosphomethylpyrimidine kinase [Sulfuracidifex metallicus]MCY0850698.1 bifunctional hydroxymethylpyrimidine kinase/phosphomethylpyrimidine kinase [Sulfuracidifex metallicus]
MKNRPIALIIAGSDSGGGAGLQADLKTLTSMGVFGVTVITGLTAQNTIGVKSIYNVDPSFISSQFDAVMEDFSVKFGKTGMLSNESIIKAVQEKVKEYNLKLVVDPVMVSKTGSPLLDESSVDALKSLMKDALLSTPNKYEAERLAGEKITSLDDLKRVARKLYKDIGNVVVKGGNMFNGTDVAMLDGQEMEIRSPKVNTSNLHGSGDVFSASIVGFLSKGASLIESIEESKKFVYFSILNSLSIGKGKGPVDPFANVESVLERENGRKTLEELLHFIEENKKFVSLMRDDFKANVSYLTNYGDVVSLAGGIIKYIGKIKLDGPLLVNLDNDVTRIARKVGGRIGILLPFSTLILKKAEMGIIKITDSGVEGDAVVFNGNIFLTASTLNQMKNKIEVLWS